MHPRKKDPFFLTTKRATSPAERNPLPYQRTSESLFGKPFAFLSLCRFRSFLLYTHYYRRCHFIIVIMSSSSSSDPNNDVDRLLMPPPSSSYKTNDGSSSSSSVVMPNMEATVPVGLWNGNETLDNVVEEEMVSPDTTKRRREFWPPRLASPLGLRQKLTPMLPSSSSS